MVKKVDPEYLQGPIPGMSLTSEPGARPWENPPVYVTVEDTVAFYTETILDPDLEDYIVNALNQKVSVETVSDHIVTSGAMNGMHTIDLAFLVDPVVRELIMYVADMAGIDYIDSYDNLNKEQRIPRAMAIQIAEEVFGESVEDKEMEEEPAPAMGGLMARRPQAPAAEPAMPPAAPMGGGMMAPPAGQEPAMPPELAMMQGGMQ